MTTYPFYPKNKAEGGERRQQKREEYGEHKIFFFFLRILVPAWQVWEHENL